MKTLFPELQKSLEEISQIEIQDDRFETLDRFAEHISQSLKSNSFLNLNFICTHNSRRSHLAQVWAQSLAFHFGINHILCYSGGTEATAVYPQIIKTLKAQGFKIGQLSELKDPVYYLNFSEAAQPQILFSKTFDHNINPQENFTAVMTCSHADENCPFIPGADKRFALTYDDPKQFDGTELVKQKYIERSKQIASELFYVFQNVKK